MTSVRTGAKHTKILVSFTHSASCHVFLDLPSLVLEMNTLVVGTQWSGQALHMSDRTICHCFGAYQGGPGLQIKIRARGCMPSRQTTGMFSPGEKATENNDQPPVESNTQEKRVGTFPDTVHDIADRTFQLNIFPRAFRNPGCNRCFARTAEGSDGRIATCMLQFINLFFPGR